MSIDAIVTHDEVNDKHGVGVLLQTVFGDGKGMLVVRSRDHFGEGTFGDRRVLLSHRRRDRRDAQAATLGALAGVPVRRLLCVPYYPDDVWTALALRGALGVPLCTWLMDDQNVAAKGIPDALMRELLAASSLRLAISPQLRDAYQAKYRTTLALAPPVVPAGLVSTDVVVPPAGTLAAGRGLVTGNVWGRRWLDLLRKTVRGSGVELDWTSPSGYRFERFEPAELERDGIFPGGTLPLDALVARLRAAPFVVIPSGTLGWRDDRASLARFSLPSRLTFALSVAHSPVIVLGDPRTAAAQFVESLGVGRVVPYDRGRFRAAVDELRRADVQRRLRERAAAIAPQLSSAGVREWVWRSLELGGPIDDRFERLGGGRSSAAVR